MTKTQTLIALGIVFLIGAAGCSSKAGNIGLGAGAAGAAYEYSNKRQLDDLKKERDAGNISQEEYDRRSEDIKDRSVVN